MDDFNDPTLPLEKALQDTQRIDYYYDHLYYLQTAIKYVPSKNIKSCSRKFKSMIFFTKKINKLMIEIYRTII